VAQLSVRWLPADGRPPEVCGLLTRPRTDVDPPRVELPSAGAYRVAAPGTITYFAQLHEHSKVFLIEEFLAATGKLPLLDIHFVDVESCFFFVNF